MSTERPGDAAAGTPPILRPPVVEPPSSDVAPVAAESGMPGSHRGGFERWPTAPIGVAPGSAVPEHDPSTAPEPLVLWAPPEPPVPYRGLARWALGLSIVALLLSTIVGWAFPIGLMVIVLAIISLRRPIESRAAAVWALVIGVVSVLYSAGWLWFAATQVDLFA